MTNIIKSASKIVFIIMAVAVVAGLFTKVIEPKDFMTLALMVFTFYFSSKGETSSDYAGK